MPPAKLVLFIATSVLQAVVTALALNLVMAQILRDVLNAAAQGDVTLVRRALWTALGAFFIGEPLLALFQYLNRWCVTTTVTEVRRQAFARMTHLTVDRVEKEHSGDVLTRMTGNIVSIEQVFGQYVVSLVYSIAFSGFALTFIFLLEWRMGLLILGINLVNILIGLAFRKPKKEISEHIKQVQADRTERFLDLVHGTAVTRLFGIWTRIQGRFDEKNEELSGARIREASINAFSDLAGNFYGVFKFVGVLAVGLVFVMRQEVDVGSIGSIIFMEGYAGILFQNLAWFIPRVQEALAGARRVFELLDWPSEAERPVLQDAEPKGAGEAEPIGRLIQMQGVRFCYKEDDTTVQVLNGVDLAAGRGQVVALVGPSGGGKSTLIKILMGFYPLDEGRVSIESKPIGAYALEGLRGMFAYVPQDAYLFAGTIGENIGYGRAGASTEEIVRAARLAHAHDFIDEQPDGYETAVGERGAKLSGGQRQRIAIARALLKDAPILLLDEATSALDSESEQLVQDALAVLMKGRTTIAIAHRLSTVENADVIYVMDEGRVVEQGRHDELVAQGGLYSRLYELQFGDDPSAGE
jgi:ABC-type multidrug transport system fused ATPase/permease subunit